MNLHEEISRIKSVIGILTEQTNTLIVSSGYTASDCDELHAFQSTKKIVDGKATLKSLIKKRVCQKPFGKSA